MRDLCQRSQPRDYRRPRERDRPLLRLPRLLRPLRLARLERPLLALRLRLDGREERDAELRDDPDLLEAPERLLRGVPDAFRLPALEERFPDAEEPLPEAAERPLAPERLPGAAERCPDVRGDLRLAGRASLRRAGAERRERFEVVPLRYPRLRGDRRAGRREWTTVREREDR
jgi:hypothetical protein